MPQRATFQIQFCAAYEFVDGPFPHILGRIAILHESESLDT